MGAIGDSTKNVNKEKKQRTNKRNGGHENRVSMRLIRVDIHIG